MSFTLIPITVNANTGKIVDPDNSYFEVRNSQRPLFPAETYIILGIHCVDNNGNDYPLNAGDAFEAGGDTDFIHDADTGTLVGTLTASTPITSLTVAGLTPTLVPASGRIRIYNAANEFELIDYTAYDSGTGVFTVDHTMTYSYAGGDRIVVNESLMFYSDNSLVDIPGDWADIDRAQGKFSIRIKNTSDYFKTEIGDDDKVQIYLECRRYPNGETIPSKLLMDTAFAENTVINSAGEPGATSMQFLTETSGDARYLNKDFSILSTKAAIVDDDTLAGNNSEDSGNVVVLTFTKLWNYIKAKADLVYSTLVPSPTAGNILTTDDSGQPVDSGKAFDDVGTTTSDIWTASKVISYVSNIIGAVVVLQGDWNADTNTPDITGTTTTGFAWRVSVDGSTDLGGITDWKVGDLAVKTSTSWLKIDNEDIAAVWGNISGTLANQTDLQSALDLKADKSNNPLNKLDATVAPTVNEDSADGYAVGSKWIDITADKAYFCLDATVAAAVWQELGAGGAGGLTYVEISTDTAATSGNFYIIDASGGTVTLTLPATPSVDEKIGYFVLDKTNTVTIARNGSNIKGAASDLLPDDGISEVLSWSGNATEGWFTAYDKTTGREVSGTFTYADITAAPAGFIEITHSYGIWKPGAKPLFTDENDEEIANLDGVDYSVADKITLDLTSFPSFSGSYFYSFVSGAGGGGGTDTDAIHDNVAGEINAISEKTTPVSADLLLFEDSEDSNNKKKVQMGNLPGGGAKTGTMLSFLGGVGDIPSGYLLRNGAAVSRSTYTDLFALTGIRFGDGDGSTTFNLPLSDTGGELFYSLSQSVRNWRSVDVAPSGNVYACADGGDIYMQTAGTGDFVGLSQTSRAWTDITCAPNGNVYACVSGGSIYMQTAGAGNFNDLSQTSRQWYGITAADNGNVYASVLNGSIYMQTAGAGSFNDLSQTLRTWRKMDAASNGDIYAVVYGGDIYMQTAGAGNFVGLGQASQNWNGLAVTDIGDIYAGVDGGDIYKQAAGAGDFVGLGQSSRAWKGMGADSNGDVYAVVYAGGIYKAVNLISIIKT